jgi:hypothetical protein
MTTQRKVELEQLFEQGYMALGVMERHLGEHEVFVGEYPRARLLHRKRLIQVRDRRSQRSLGSLRG